MSMELCGRVSKTYLPWRISERLSYADGGGSPGYEVATVLLFLVCWSMASENNRVVKAVGRVLSFDCTVFR